MALIGLYPPRFPGGRLNQRRVYTYCGVLLAIEIVLFVFLAAGTYGLIVTLDKPTTTDFVSFYAAGNLADSGHAQLAYNRDVHYAAEQQATKSGIDYNFFYYPPVFLLICAALARLPYLVAFLVFESVTFALYLLVARRILGETSWAGLVPIVAFPPVFWTIGLGQNAFLTAALFGAATLLVDSAPIAAGLLFGALCYKPHFALLVPVALIAGRHWQAFTGAFVSATVLCLLSLTLFGWQTWHAFLTAAAESHVVYESGQVAFGGFITPFGAVLLLGGKPALAYSVQAIATAAAAVLVAIVWRSHLPLPLRAATLASATLVAVPLAIVYDLILAAIAGIWLLRSGGRYRLLEWERWTLAVLFVLTLNPRAIAEQLHLPVGPFAALAFAVLVATKALRPKGTIPSLAIGEPARQ
jgi:alpha-1,2-mannosyltransferase